MDDFEARYDAALQGLKEAAIAKGEREASARIRRELEAELAGDGWVERYEIRRALDRICPEAPGETEPAASVHEIPGVGPVTVPDQEEDPPQRASSYRAALAGVVALPATMDYSLAVFGKRLANFIRDEQAKHYPDSSLIALLCDAARLGDELVRGMERQDRGAR